MLELPGASQRGLLDFLLLGALLFLFLMSGEDGCALSLIRQGDPLWWPFLGSLVVLALAMAGACLLGKQNPTRETVLASPSELRVVQQFRLGRREERRLPAAELKALVVADDPARPRSLKGSPAVANPVIVARTDRDMCIFGRRLTDEERVWVLGAIRRVMGVAEADADVPE